MWSLDFIRRKNHDQQGARGKKWRFFHNFATFVRERLRFMRQFRISHNLADGYHRHSQIYIIKLYFHYTLHSTTKIEEEYIW